MSVYSFLEAAVRDVPDRSFLLFGEHCVSYGQFTARVNRLAASFAALGAEQGSRVAVILPNGPEILYAWMALARLGAVLVPLNPAHSRSEIRPLLGRFRVDAIVAESDRLANLSEGLDLRFRVGVGPGGSPDGPDSWAASMGSGDDAPRIPSPDDSLSIGAILLSSGTSGDRVKGVGVSHDTYTLPAEEFKRFMRITGEDRFLGCLPLFHIAGGVFAISAIAARASLVIVDRFRGSLFWEQVARYRVTVVRYLGEMLAVLLRRPEADTAGHSLRAAYGGGARPEIAAQFESRFGVPVVEGYGLTEATMMLRNELERRRSGSIGRPLPYSEVRIAAESGNPVSDGEVGEIQIKRNPVMMLRYVGDPELTRSCFAGDWFRTGDLGYRDSDGYVFFVDRKKQVIRRRGENVIPAEVERVLSRHPAVTTNAVVGVPDGVGGEEIKAYVAVSPACDVSVEDLVGHCRSSLAEYKIPRYFEICSRLPSTPTNKVDKGSLRRMGTLGGLLLDRRLESKTRWKVSILIFEGVQLLDFTGPVEVFADAGSAFDIFTVSEFEGPVVASGGVSINSRYTMANCPSPDILLVPGGESHSMQSNRRVIEWIQTISATSKLVLSVCTGAILLAKAGLLDNLEATTHSSALDTLRRLAPSATVHAERRFVDNGKIITSAGVSSGIDMSIYIVGRLLGWEAARRTARYIEYDYWTPSGLGEYEGLA